MYLKINKNNSWLTLKTKAKKVFKKECQWLYNYHLPAKFDTIVLHNLNKKSQKHKCQNNAKNWIQNIKLIYILGIANTKWLAINFQPKNDVF